MAYEESNGRVTNDVMW